MRPANSAPNNIPVRSAFAPWNLFSGLLLINEQASFRLVKKVLEDYGLKVHPASSVVEVAQLMRSRRLDLAIFDYDLPWMDQLAYLEPSSNWRGLTIAVGPQEPCDHYRSQRVHFTLPRPLTASLLVRALKASYSNMAQKRIATYRHTVPARLISGTLNHRGWQRTLHQVSVLNLSQTGLCLGSAEPLPHGASLTMSLTLPEFPHSVHATGNVVWSNSSGRTGVSFDRSAGPEMKKLHERLNALLPRELGMVARWS
ncbi:MAG: PilZ domain-containing protein [Candidatus Angelobacter sp.]